jgi:hypothetical protein
VAAFGGLKKIQNGGPFHANQGTKWPPTFWPFPWQRRPF